MDFQVLADLYRAKTDEELVNLGQQFAQLTSNARLALSAELAKRRIDFEAPKVGVEVDLTNERSESRSEPVSAHIETGRFVEEVLQLYNQKRWHFVHLISPAVLLTFAAYFVRQHETWQIERNVARGIEIPQYRALLEIGLLTWGSFLCSWIMFSFCFGAICVSTKRLIAGSTVSVIESFRTVRKRTGTFLRLSMFLFVLFILCVGIFMAISIATFTALRNHNVRLSSTTLWLISYCAFSVALLIFSRFSLAIPAFVLEEQSVGKAMFRSDELTGGKWPILVVLSFKSVAGGYVAALLPFWIARFIPASVHLPSWFGWFLTGSSVASVTFVEPIAFIGFALLYLKAAPDPAVKQQAASA